MKIKKKESYSKEERLKILEYILKVIQGKIVRRFSYIGDSYICLILDFNLNLHSTFAPIENIYKMIPEFKKYHKEFKDVIDNDARRIEIVEECIKQIKSKHEKI